MTPVKETVIIASDKSESRVIADPQDLSSLHKNNPNPVAQIDSNGIVLYANDACRSVLELWRADIGSRVSEEYLKVISDVLASGNKYQSEENCEEFIWSLTWVPDVKTNTVNVYGTEQSERIHAYHYIKRYAERIEHILECTIDAYLFVDENWHITYLNSQGERLLQSQWDAVIGKNVWDAFPEMAGSLYKNIKRAVEDNNITHFEGYYSPADKWLEIHVQPFKDETSIYFHDISVRVKSAQNAIDNEKRLRSTLDNVVDAVITINENGIIESFNAGAEKIFGYETDEVINKNINILMPEPYKSSHDNYLKNYMRSGVAKIIGIGRELTGLKKDGTTFPIELAIGEIRVGEQRVFTGVARDITERKQAEEMLKLSHDQLEQRIKARTHELEEMQSQLMQSEKMASIGQLAAGVAHEINNPVGYINSNIGSLKKYIDELFQVLKAYEETETFIKGNSHMMEYIENLKKKVDLDYLKGDILELIKESQEGVKRVKQIVQDLKDFSHVDELEWQYADLHKGLDSTLNIVHNEIKYKAEVIKNYGDLPQIECIPSQINQVFMNLLVNASHAIEDRGIITLVSGVVGNEVYVSVSDTGKGIEKENLKRIFDPFFTTKPVGKGTGLGLSLAYSIINKHNGRIEVESETGKGTTFRIVLPVEQDESKIKKAD